MASSFSPNGCPKWVAVLLALLIAGLSVTRDPSLLPFSLLPAATPPSAAALPTPHDSSLHGASPVGTRTRRPAAARSPRPAPACAWCPVRVGGSPAVSMQGCSVTPWQGGLRALQQPSGFVWVAIVGDSLLRNSFGMLVKSLLPKAKPVLHPAYPDEVLCCAGGGAAAQACTFYKADRLLDSYDPGFVSGTVAAHRTAHPTNSVCVSWQFGKFVYGSDQGANILPALEGLLFGGRGEGGPPPPPPTRPCLRPTAVLTNPGLHSLLHKKSVGGHKQSVTALLDWAAAARGRCALGGASFDGLGECFAPPNPACVVLGQYLVTPVSTRLMPRNKKHLTQSGVRAYNQATAKAWAGAPSNIGFIVDSRASELVSPGKSKRSWALSPDGMHWKFGSVLVEAGLAAVARTVECGGGGRRHSCMWPLLLEPARCPP